MVPATRELSDLQTKFLEHLFGEAMGDANKAKKMAGYDPTTSTAKVVKSVHQEILEHSKLYLATHTPRALLELQLMLLSPNEPGASTKLKSKKFLIGLVLLILLRLKGRISMSTTLESFSCPLRILLLLI